MQHQRARVGDTVDDYCPRNNRVTEHTVVATTDDDVSVTRCQVCDMEHDHPGTATMAGGGLDASAETLADPGNVVAEDQGPVRRSLIRATLKHPEGVPSNPRPAPVFTMHEQPGSGSQGRGNTPHRGFSGNSRPGHESSGQPKKKVGRWGGQARKFNQAQPSGNQAGSNRASGNKVHADADRPGGRRSPSSRRGRGRSR